MSHPRRVAAALLAALLAGAPALARPAGSAPPPLPIAPIAYTRTILANGLTLIVHEDHKAPVVSVDIWYHVGSKNEPPGRTGFAHLFEHLMFGSTGGNQRGWFEKLEGMGATDINGTTNEDRTNFYETVPTPALDTVLGMEAGRMGHLLDSFNIALLTTQRGVVQNEKRQYDNQPYAVSDEIITRSVWPAQHPYSHTVIGELTDLDAARVEDVKSWFATYYGPTNATLVLSGDITPADARAKVERYFGAIPPGPPISRQKVWVARRTGHQRAIVQDRVPQARLYIEWNAPPRGSPDADSLDLLTDVLSVGKDSRLFKRLVYQDHIATEEVAAVEAREIGGLIDVQLTAAPGVPLARLEAAFDEELARLLHDGPSPAELDRYKTRLLAGFVRRAERVGTKSDLLASSQAYFGTPDAWRTDLERIRSATPATVADAGRRWMSDGAFTLEVTPFPSFAPVPGAASPAVALADAATLPPSRFPAVRRARLSNGLAVVVAERHETPIVDMQLVLDVGSASDPAGQTGLSQLEAATLLDGTADLDALQFEDRKLGLGAEMSANVGSDTTQISMSAFSARLDGALDLFADVVLKPALRPSDVAREKALIVASIAQQKQDPGASAFRVLFPLVFGADHPYGRVPTEAGVAALTPTQVRLHHDRWFQPTGATLIVAGDTTLEAILPRLEARLGRWHASAAAPVKTIPPVAPASAPTVYLIDKPGAEQTLIAAAGLAPPQRNPDDVAIEAMTTTLGGAFTSRLNLNLREDKHWSYGAGSFIAPARSLGLFAVYAPVQTDKTGESYTEVRRELTGIVGPRPVTPGELELARHTLTLSLPGRWETNGAISGSLAYSATYGLADDYWSSYAARVGAVGQGDVQRAAVQVVRPETLTWVIVGDRAKVQAPLEALGLTVRPIDADGKPTK